MFYHDLLIENAKTEDGPSILELLKSRARDLKYKGSEQWSFLLTGQEDAEIIAFVSKGLFFKVSTNTNSKGKAMPPLAATFMLSDMQEDWDVHLWGQDDSPGTVYLHKLAVSLDYKGQGLGDVVVDWIKQYAEENVYTKIRLDCVAGSEKLKDFYQKHGFILLKIVAEHCLFEWEPSKAKREVHDGKRKV